MATGSPLDTPPDLQPTVVGPLDLGASELLDVSNLLLQILSRLTVYQSLPDVPGLVLTVRDDVPMLDACCLFLPCQSSTVVEVLPASSPLTQSTGDSPSSKSNRLLAIASSKSDDFMFAKALEHEAARVTSAYAADSESVDPVGDFLSVDDVIFFLRKILRNDDPMIPELTVRDWIAGKRSAVFRLGTPDDVAWVRFCETSTLVQRGSLNMSQGVQPNQVITGSSMNLSSSNLMTTDGSIVKKSRSGGSCLAAVNSLLERPWQASLPLTVVTEKCLTAVFGYTTMKQLMVHVAMNCSDRLLEPFFTSLVDYESLRGTAEKNIESCPFLDFDVASLHDALEVLPASLLVFLVAGRYQTYQGVLLAEELLDQLRKRIDSSEELISLKGVRIKALLPADSSNEKAAVLHESDFPLPLANLLQTLLMSYADAIIVLSQDETPIGVITSRDIWAYVMQGTVV